MFRNLSIFLCLVFLSSCNCQTARTDKDNKVSSEKIKVFLREKNFEIVESANLVVVFNIEKKLLEGTTDEYSNKVVLKDTMATEKAKKLVALLKDDSSYFWESAEDLTSFNPTRQFLIKNDKERIFLLVDEPKAQMGFINLDGQKTVKLSNNMSEYFKDILN